MPIKFASRDVDIPLKDLSTSEVWGKMFADITGLEFDQFKASIRDTGQKVNIIVEKNGDGYVIVDGKQRFRAATDLGLSSIFCDILAGSWKTVDDGERMAFVNSLNKHRRHLKFSEKVKKYTTAKRSQGSKRGRPKNNSDKMSELSSVSDSWSISFVVLVY